MRRWMIMIGCLLLWHGDGMAQGKEGMPAEMARKVTELEAQVEALYSKGEYDAALEPARETLAIRERYLGDSHPDVAQSLNDLGVLYQSKGDYERALPLYERALAIREKALGPAHPDIAQSLNNLAGLYDTKGDYERALPLYERALAIREKALGPAHPDVAQSLNNLAWLHHIKGDYERALPLHERALAIWQEALGSDHPDVAASLNNLAGLHDSKGDYERALPLYERALATWQKVLGPAHPRVASSLNNLAGLYLVKGDYERALPLYERALAINEKALGPAHPDVAVSLNNLARLHEAKGDYERALPLYERALAISERALGPAHPDVALSLNSLARLLYEAKGDYERALPLHERALAIRESSLGPDHPAVAVSYHDLALLHQAKGDYERALPLLERALAIDEKALGPAHPSFATSLSTLAYLHEAKGDYKRALPLLERALVIREKALGPAHPHVATSLGNIAALHWAQGKMAEANHYFRSAEDAREAHLKLTIVADSERGKRMFLATLAGDIDASLALALQTRHPDAMHLAFTKVLRRKGRVLGSMSATFAAVRRHPDAGVRALWEEYRSNRAQYATQLLRGPERISPEQHRKNLDTLEQRAVELERLLADRSREFRDEQVPITVEAVQAALPRGTALVEWIRYRRIDPKMATEANKSKPRRYAACVLLAAGPPRCRDLGEAEAIDADIKELRNALGRNLATLPDIARRLDAKIMAPVRAYLGDISRVYLSPDGPLQLIPFAALRDEQGRYLVERYTFTYLTSGRELMHRGSTEHASSPVMITFDPDYGEPGPGQRRAFSFPLLPGADYEAETVAAMFGEPLVLRGPDASEARLKQAHSPLIWHHAGHGFFQPLTCAASGEPADEQPADPGLQSGLAMAGAHACKDGDDDGLLTAVEVAGLDLGGTRLVVLSACETGVGATSLRETSGRETGAADGVYGLRRALAIAGSETQMMSLWRVEDRPTRHLIEAYYRNLLEQGMGRSEALRQVQLAWLKEGSIHASPYYWAAFVVSGNDAPLDSGTLSTVPRVQRSARGCACDAGATSSNLGHAWGIALLCGLLLITLERRRRAPL